MESLHKRQAVIALSALVIVVCPHVRADSSRRSELVSAQRAGAGPERDRVHRYAADFDLRIPADPDSSKGWMDDAVIDVPDHFTISDLDVKISVTHTKVFDLQIFIAGPAGTRLCLNMYDPLTEYFDGENYTQTIFDDEAGTPIERGEPPFTGRFRPRQPYRLSTFDGEDAFGPWRLQIYDAYHADTGQLHHAELIITTEEQPALTIVTPNGGEVLTAGETYPITWSSTGSVDDVLVEYSTDRGSSWSAVDPPNTGNTGLYDWQVPLAYSGTPPGGNHMCLIRISAADQPGIGDVSDSAFSIGPAHTVTPPRVTTLAGSTIGHDAVVLSGRIEDDGGEPCRYRFRYAGSWAVYTSWSDPCRCKTAGQEFSACITDLAPGIYCFWAQAKNSAGASDWGRPESFTIEQPFSGAGSGTPQDPYIITDINELQQMNNDLSASYELGCDIDARATEPPSDTDGFVPIGSCHDCFTGVFQGAGHIIRGLWVDSPGDSCVGLFGQAAGSRICNVGLLDVHVTGGRYVGGLVGLNFGEVEEVYVAGGVHGLANIGGLAGANHGNITNCYCCVDVCGRAGGQAIGGFVGAIEQGMVKNCYCIGAVTGPERAGLAGIQNGSRLHCFRLVETMKQQASFTGWDFDGVWGIIEGTTYPFLKGVRPAVPGQVLCPVVGQCDVVRLADEWEIHPDPAAYHGDTPEAIYAVADAIVCTANAKMKTKKSKVRHLPEADDFFDVLIQHSYWGHVWWSAYLGLSDVQVCPGQEVDSASIVGYLPNPGLAPQGLRFAVYLPDVQLGLAPFGARIVPRRLHPSALSFKAAELARQVVGASYLCGGKGYDFDEARFVDANDIRLDAAGLVFWAYNKAQGAARYQQAHRPHNPVHYDTVAGQYWNNCIAIDRAELLPGDLVFFDTPRRGLYEQTGDKTAVDHVAMYVGDFGYPGGVIQGTYYPPGTYDCVEARDDGLDGCSGVVPRTLSGARITAVYEDAGLLADAYFFCPARVVEPTVAAVVYTTGPVDVVLGEANGLVITSQMPEVADRLYYSVFDIDQDGRLDDMVTIAAATPGIYTVGVVQEPDALPADIFSLTLVTPAQVTILADNVEIQDIPSPWAQGQGYEFTLCE